MTTNFENVDGIDRTSYPDAYDTAFYEITGVYYYINREEILFEASASSPENFIGSQRCFDEVMKL